MQLILTDIYIYIYIYIYRERERERVNIIKASNQLFTMENV
jgi:hypothetical protein